MFEAVKKDALLARQAGRDMATEDAEDKTATLESTLDPSRGSQWLVLCRPQGVIEVS